MLIAVILVLSCLLLFAVWQIRKSVLKTRELQRRTRELERAVKQRAHLAREVAHELRNPITAILCSADTLHLLLMDRVEDNLLRCFGYIREYGDSILRLVNDFIDVSAGDIGQIRSEAKPTIVCDVVKSVFGLLEASANRKSITVTIEANSDARALVDPRHLKQIVFNLLHNAIKFTQHNGEITIRLDRSVERSAVQIEVLDNGVGISERELKELFDPYSPSRAERKHSEQGVGLGLPLTRRLVRSAGGDMEVESAEGSGTKIVVYLPLVETKWSEGNSKEHVTVPNPLAGQSILVVDSHNGARMTLEGLISALGGLAESVSSATEAVDALNDKQYSALLIDDEIEMSSVEELMKVLKRDPRHAATKIVVARNSEEESELKGDQEIEKPVNGMRLLAGLVEGH